MQSPSSFRSFNITICIPKSAWHIPAEIFCLLSYRSKISDIHTKISQDPCNCAFIRPTFTLTLLYVYPLKLSTFLCVLSEALHIYKKFAYKFVYFLTCYNIASYKVYIANKVYKVFIVSYKVCRLKILTLHYCSSLKQLLYFYLSNSSY